MESIDLFSIATIAFLGSFGHCIGMCGGIVIAYISSKIDNQSKLCLVWDSLPNCLTKAHSER